MKLIDTIKKYRAFAFYNQNNIFIKVYDLRRNQKLQLLQRNSN